MSFFSCVCRNLQKERRKERQKEFRRQMKEQNPDKYAETLVANAARYAF